MNVQQDPASTRPIVDDDPHDPRATIERLSDRECWDLAAATDGPGRLGFIAPDGAPDVVPLDFAVTNRQIYCRTSPGAKATAITDNPQVAFEIDGVAGAQRWSVVFRGVAWRMEEQAEIDQSGITALAPSLPLPTDVFLRIAPLRVTGRRFTAAPREHT